MDEITTNIANGVSGVLGELYKDLAQPSFRAIGKALGNVFELFPLMTLHIKYWSEKAKLNFNRRLKDYAKKLEEIPKENLAEVPPEIGVPIVERLVYTTNDELADLFTTLLASASNIDTLHLAHPSFIKIIESLAVDEARIIKFLRDQDYIPFCVFKAYCQDTNHFKIILDDATLISNEVHLDMPKNVHIYLENLVSHGILEKRNDMCLTDELCYNKIKEYYNYEEMKEALVPYRCKKLVVKKGYFQITNLGKQLFNACIK